VASPRGPALFRLLRRALPPGAAFRWGVTLYPPYLGAGVVCTRATDDLRIIEVELRMHSWNRNFVGTHFGGSLYAMCDPFYMLILIEALGDLCVVWDKRASITYVRPGRGTVRARFEVPDARIAQLRQAFTDGARSLEETFEVDVVDDEDRVVAHVEKVVYLRRKDLYQAPADG